MPGPTRRSRAVGGRPHQITVWLSREELAAVTRAAERAGMAPGAWLGESGVASAGTEPGAGVAGGRDVALELMALRSELMESRRVLTNIGGNLNDVARHANSTSELHAATGDVQALVARVVARVESVAGHVDQRVAAILGRRRRAGHGGHDGDAVGRAEDAVTGDGHDGHSTAGHGGRTGLDDRGGHSRGRGHRAAGGDALRPTSELGPS